jgi:exodeoxyribonuclease V beta subunit
MSDGIQLLEASAGTGKTFCIAQQVLALVAEEGIAIERIVVVTFTKAATAELRTRVRDRLRDALAGIRARQSSSAFKAPDDVLRSWLHGLTNDLTAAELALQQALINFDQAGISTLHGFCHWALQRYSFLSGTRFDLQLTAPSTDLRAQIVDDFWTRQVVGASQPYRNVLKQEGITRASLRELAKLSEDGDLKIVGPPVPGELPDFTLWMAARNHARQQWEPAAIEALLCREGMRKRSSRGSGSFPPKRTQKDIAEVQAHLQHGHPGTELPAGVEHFSQAYVASATEPGNTPPTHPGFEALAEYAALHTVIQAQVLQHIRGIRRELVNRVRSELPERLCAARLQTYDDLLRELRDALTDSDAGAALAQAIRCDLDVALIDEFQDTDPVQWQVFSTLFPTRLYLVGDPKQSIYSFRGADIHTYERAKEVVDQFVSLDMNYRSDGRLVSALNHVFATAKHPFGAPTPAYIQIKPFHPSTRISDERPPLQIRFMPRTENSSYRGWLTKDFLDRRLPQVVAEDIAAELARATMIEGRGITPGDCAVLTRTNFQARSVQIALRQRGIPAVVRSDDSVMASDIVADLVQVLAPMVNPLSAALIKTALVTPLLGWSGDDLGSLDLAPERMSEQMARFRRWHTTWEERGFHTAFQQFLDEDDTVARALRHPDGRRRVTDLLHIAELLHAASIRNQLGPVGVLAWLRRGAPDASEEDLKPRIETDANAVTISTVHKAKGLEYGFVWCPYLWSGSFVHRNELPEFHDDDGQRCIDICSADFEAHKTSYAREKQQEDQRMAYVALTRARHRCVVYWGFKGSAPLGWLLHQPSEWSDPALVWLHVQGLNDAALCEDLDQLATHPDIAWDRLDWDAPNTAPNFVPPPPTDALAVRALTRTHPIDTWWRRASYTSLSRAERIGPVDTAERGGHDDLLPALPPLHHTVPVPLHDLAGGTNVGNFMHAVFEHHDFQKPEALASQVATQLQAYGLDLDGDRVVVALQDVLDSPLPMNTSLSRLSRHERLDELEFTFPVRDAEGALNPSDLADSFRDIPSYAARLQRLAFVPLRGVLTGAIDLVFRHDGRFYVVDYKSNWLGATFGDYTPERLQHEMDQRHYTLQAHLYGVALHRFLMSRVANYRFEDHFGGLCYLFLRGMTPASPGSGVWFHRPPVERIERIDTAFRGAI